MGVGGMMAIAGCSGDSNEESEEDSQEEPENPEPANFEIVDMDPTGYTNHHPEVHSTFTVEIENTGDIEDTQTVGFEIEGITEEEKTVTLDGGRSTRETFDGFFDEGEDRTYPYSYKTEDEEREAGEVFIFECPPESELPDNRPLGSEDLGYDDIERANIDVRLLNDGDEYSDSELILIAKHVVCEFSTEYDWHAISTTFWERGDNPGFTQAYAECNWAPNGNWSEAGDTELGNYSQHDYSLRRI